MGKDKGPTAELAEEYAGRIRRSAELTLLELRAEGPEREAESLLGKIRGELWAVDERGTLLGSTQLSQRLEKLRDTAQELTLCIGGDEGLASRVREEARFVWSLSPLTLPSAATDLVTRNRGSIIQLHGECLLSPHMAGNGCTLEERDRLVGLAWYVV